jgi:hypothetical protein
MPPTKRRRTGTAGPRGRAGRTGPRGPSGHLSVADANRLRTLSDDMEKALADLRIQFIRFSQMQAEIDGLRARLDRVTKIPKRQKA